MSGAPDESVNGPFNNGGGGFGFAPELRFLASQQTEKVLPVRDDDQGRDQQAEEGQGPVFD